MIAAETIADLQTELLGLCYQRADAALQALSKGLDVRPADIYRFEGLVEAAQLAGVTEQQLREQLITQVRTVLGDAATPAYTVGPVSLHMQMHEAPVYAPGQQP